MTNGSITYRCLPCSALFAKWCTLNLWVLKGLGLVCCLFIFGVCDAAQSRVFVFPAVANPATTQSKESRMWMNVGERRFAITLAENEAARAFAALLPLSIDMADLNRNEKHVELAKSLPTNASHPGTVHTGDLMLYGSQTLVVFYMTFKSAYSYTRLGRVDDPSGLDRALGIANVQVFFSKD